MNIHFDEISCVEFDYKSLDPIVAGDAKFAAEHIRDILKQRG